MSRKVIRITAALTAFLPSLALAGSVGFVPNSFTDGQVVTIRFQHQSNTNTGQVWVKVRVRDGASANAPPIYSPPSRAVTFSAGVRKDVDFKPLIALGQKASGIKLRAEAGFVPNPNAPLTTPSAVSVITKQCTPATSDPTRRVTCRWAHFSRIPAPPPPRPPHS